MSENSVLIVLLVYYYTKSLTRNQTLFLIKNCLSLQNTSGIVEQLFKFGKNGIKNKLNNSYLFFAFGIELTVNYDEKNYLDLIRLEYYVSKYYYMKKYYNMAEKKLNYIYTIVKNIDTKDDYIEKKILLKLSKVYFKFSQFNESIVKLNELKVSLESENSNDIRKYKYLSNVYYFLGLIYSTNIELCIPLQLMSAEYQQKCSKVDNYKLLNNSLCIAIASKLFNKPLYQFALFWYQKAFDCFNKLQIKGDKRTHNISSSKLNKDIGLCYYNLNHFKTAIYWFDKNLSRESIKKDKEILNTCNQYRILCLKHIRCNSPENENYVSSDFSSHDFELTEDIYKVCPQILDLLNKYNAKQLTLIETLNQIANFLILKENHIELITCKLKNFGTFFYFKSELPNASLFYKFAIELLESQPIYDHINIFKLKDYYLNSLEIHIYKEEVLKSEKLLIDLSEIFENWEKNENHYLIDRYEMLSEVYKHLGRISDISGNQSELDFYVKAHKCLLKWQNVNNYELYLSAKHIAQLMIIQNNHQSAHDWYMKSYESLNALKYRPEHLDKIAEFNYEIGYFLLCFLKNPEKAIKWFEKNMNSEEFSHLTIIVEKTKLYYGFCLFLVKNYRHAIEYLKTGLFENSTKLSMSEKICTFKYLCASYISLNDYNNAVITLSDLNKIFKKSQDKTAFQTHKIKEYLRICLKKIDSEEYNERAIECFVDLISLFKSSSIMESRDNYVLGLVHFKLAFKSISYKLSIKHYSRAEKFFANTIHMKILCICKIAELHENSLKLKLAVNKFSEATLLLTNKIMDKHYLLINEKRIEKFFDSFRDYIIIKPMKDQHLLEIKNYYSACLLISKFYMIKKHFDLGLCYFSRLKQLSEEFEEFKCSFNALSFATAIAAFQSKNDNTLDFIDKAIELLGPTRNSAYLLEYKSKFVDEIQAEEYLKRALEVHEKGSGRIPLIYYKLAVIKLENNKEDEAIAYINEAKKYVKLPEQQLIFENNLSIRENASKGYCLIFNNMESTNANEFKLMFEKFNYSTVVENGLNYNEFVDKIHQIQHNKHLLKVNAFVIIITSYGNMKKVSVLNNEKKFQDYSIEKIIDKFDNNSCENLCKIPKILIFITQTPHGREQEEEDSEINSGNFTEEAVKFCPLSHICVWNIHFNSQQLIHFTPITQILEIHAQDIELREFFKIAEKELQKNLINYESSQRFIGWTNDFYFNPSKGVTNEKNDRMKMNEKIGKVLNENCGKRFAAIIHNTSFDDYNEDRIGSGADIINIAAKLLELSYQFIARTNLRGSQIKQFFKEFLNNSSLNHCDSLVVIILTHGGTDVIYGIDKVSVRIEEIFQLFSDNHCPQLIGKQKVFLINACRGNKESTLDSDSYTESGDSPVSSTQFDSGKHVFNDMFVWYSSIYKYVSYRNPSNGSRFISSIIRVLNHFNNDIEISEMAKYVNQMLMNESKTKDSLNPKGTMQISEVELRGWKTDFKF